MAADSAFITESSERALRFLPCEDTETSQPSSVALKHSHQVLDLQAPRPRTPRLQNSEIQISVTYNPLTPWCFCYISPNRTRQYGCAVLGAFKIKCCTCGGAGSAQEVMKPRARTGLQFGRLSFSKGGRGALSVVRREESESVSGKYRRP